MWRANKGKGPSRGQPGISFQHSSTESLQGELHPLCQYHAKLNTSTAATRCQCVWPNQAGVAQGDGKLEEAFQDEDQHSKSSAAFTGEQAVCPGARGEPDRRLLCNWDTSPRLNQGSEAPPWDE